MCVLCVGVKINKRSFKPFCVWIFSFTGQDIDKLQKAKPSLDEYKGKPPSKPRNSNSPANEDSRDYSTEVLPRWRDVDPDWSDPWTRREPAGYTYIRPDVEFVAG